VLHLLRDNSEPVGELLTTNISDFLDHFSV
jgi:hypothetical protein